jgi:hypothetical protein
MPKPKKPVPFSTHVPLWRKKRIIRSKTKQMVNKGEIKKENCEVCGSSESEIHHLDYDNALDIKWLCKIHHREIHRCSN